MGRIFFGKKIFAVFRKRVPITFLPSMLYMYINNPSSRVIGKAKIKKIDLVDISTAISLSSSACISGEEIKSYIGNSSKLGVYLLDTFVVAPTPATLRAIRKYMKFYPPQSFLILSRQSKALLDNLCSFKKAKR
jgi:predicted transcriptional regulator